MIAENIPFFIQNNLLTKYVVILYYKRVEPDRKTPKLGNRACACPSKELKEFQRGVLNMMQLHPQANVLAECVFQRSHLKDFWMRRKYFCRIVDAATIHFLILEIANSF